ncbi:hypothetical protein EDB80DRAFT_839027 [Ilyonectria destructans]|nr:hypothetical protein EDB80DRAFT_839027 [Ilyonectria destructans]
MPTTLHSRSATLGGPGASLAGPHAPTQSNAPSTAWCRRLNTSCDAPTRWSILLGRPLRRAPVTRFTTPIGLRRRDCYRGLALPPASRQPLTGPLRAVVRITPGPCLLREVGRLDMAPSAIRLALAHAASPPSPRLVSSSPHPNSGTCFQLFQLLLQLDASISRSFVSLGKDAKQPLSTRQLADPTTRCYRGLAQAARANLESIVSGRRRSLLELG